jgi:hypothetical protein
MEVLERKRSCSMVPKFSAPLPALTASCNVDVTGNEMRVRAAVLQSLDRLARSPEIVVPARNSQPFAK